MKSLTAIGFLVLLLYHWIGLPLAVLTFEQGYESATVVSADDHWKLVKLPISLPYTADWENADGQEGLVQDGDEFYNIVHQRYANDTLYTLLKTNQNAKERFFTLTEQLQELSTDQAPPKSPLGQLLKLLKERLTTYLSQATLCLTQPTTLTVLTITRCMANVIAWYNVATYIPSPPPEK